MIIYKNKILPGFEVDEIFSGYRIGRINWEYHYLTVDDLEQIRDFLEVNDIEYLILREVQYEDQEDSLIDGVCMTTSDCDDNSYGKDISDALESVNIL